MRKEEKSFPFQNFILHAFRMMFLVIRLNNNYNIDGNVKL